eukprot:SAG22_NODE_11745_length_471_cov_0.801075_1_plen_43_part_10
MTRLNAHLVSFIGSLNSGAGLGFFLYGIHVSEQLVTRVVGFVS